MLKLFHLVRDYPTYDEYKEMIVAAENELQARQLAVNESIKKAEGINFEYINQWLRPSWERPDEPVSWEEEKNKLGASCEEIGVATSEIETGVIMTYYLDG